MSYPVSAVRSRNVYPRLGEPPPVPTDLVIDTFTDVNATLLENHIPDLDVIGGGWSIMAGVWTIRADIVYTSTQATRAGALIETGASDVRMSMICSCNAALATMRYSGAIFRFTNVDNRWIVGFNNRTGAFDIMRVQGGVETVVASTPVTISGQHSVKVLAVGDQITGWFDDANAISTTDNFNSTVTAHGMTIGGSSIADARMNDFEVSTP